MFQIRSQATSRFSSAAKRSLASCASRSSSARLVGVEVALVEELLGGLDDGGDDPGPADDAARRADRAVPDLGGDLAQLERELRRAGERVAALVHRRRAGVRGLARPRDAPALDAVGAEHGAEGNAHRLEHRPLLDVELEVGRGRLELRPRLEGPVEVDAVRSERVGERDPVPVGQLAQLVLVAHRAARRRGAEERAAEARALLVGPVDEPDRDRRRALLGDPAQHLGARDDVEAAVEPAAVRDRVDVAADQDGALRLAAQRPPVVAGCVALALEREAVEEPVEPGAGRVPRVRPRDALGAVLVARELLELAQLRDDATGIEGHGATLDDLRPWPETAVQP